MYRLYWPAIYALAIVAAVGSGLICDGLGCLPAFSFGFSAVTAPAWFAACCIGGAAFEPLEVWQARMRARRGKE